MRKTLLTSMLISAVFGTAYAYADTLAVPAEDAAVRMPTSVPTRGQTMGAVTRAFGEPRLKHAAVGGGSDKQPPITRWDYDGYYVVFERSHVVDVVIQGAPAPVSRVDELRPAQ